MREVTRPGDAGKWETVRRLRYGDVLKLIRYRYGANGVPDDDALDGVAVPSFDGTGRSRKEGPQ